MFKEILQEVVDGTEGGIAALIMGYDGIPLDNYVRDGRTFDVETVGMEFTVILKNIQNAAELLDAGGATEVAIKAERMTTLLRYLSEEYFVAVALAPEANLGKARFLLRTRAGKLAEALS
jgi:predicted regulator of Ras-like GTPase activity (Roadblock/LC7/MglB family)